MMTIDEATREVELRHGRRAYLSPEHAATSPAMFTAFGLGALEVLGIGFIPWWGLILSTAAVWLAVRHSTAQKNQEMQDEIRALMRK